MERQNRKPIEWEDTLTKSELAYQEKLKAQNETIQAFKEAQEQDGISGYLHALSLKDIPSEFSKVKREFQLRVQDLIAEEAKLTHLKARSYDNHPVIAMHLEFRYESLVDIDTKKRAVHVKGKKWLNEFSKYLDNQLFNWRDEWLEIKKGRLEGRVARANEAYDKEVEEIEAEESLLKKERREWEDGQLFPPAIEIIKEADRIVELLKSEGFTIHIDGMERKNHYMLKARYRWEEDHTETLTKLQRKFARPVNQPSRDDRNTSFASGMVERQIGNLFVLTTPSNEFTQDFYERRFTIKEWNTLRSIPSLSNFKVNAGYEVIYMTYEPTGTKFTIYPNGHIWVEVPEDANEDRLETRLGLLPLLWHPAIKEFLKEMGDTMRHY